MLQNREDLKKLAKEHYVKLLEKVARRYETNEVYTLVDLVGYECARVEELFRPLWGIAPFLHDRDFKIKAFGKKMHVTKFITRIILEGTDKNSPKCFDRDMTVDTQKSFCNQCITEIAAYLVAVHFAKDVLWDVLSKKEQEQVATWIHRIAMIALKDSWPNNHYWYPIFSIEILKQLGYYDASAEEYLKKGYQELESLYISNGWYCDGKDFGRFDYYEAWAHHTYTLLWTLIADKSNPENLKKCEAYKKRSEEFLKFYAHYFDFDGGMVAYGRSLSYRFAAVSAFGLAAKAGCNIDFARAKNIILKNINYFFENSLPTHDGCFESGYLYSSPRFSEVYASDGATCCYTEGFMCLLAEDDHPLWTAKASQMVIEEKDYLLECPVDKLDFLVQGENDFGGVTLYNNAIHYFQDRNYKFNDMFSYYSKFCYNSRAGFSISSHDRVGYDNMISIFSADHTMFSLRGKINTISSSKEMLVSSHVPFVNDPESTITSYVIPLSKGYHVRIHKVILSRAYQVQEGGFCIGTVDDSHRFKDGVLCYKNMISGIDCVSNVKVVKKLERAVPGMHNLRPMAYYPAYETEELKKGEYIFASSVFFTTDKVPETKPIVTIENNQVTVEFEDYKKTIMV